LEKDLFVLLADVIEWTWLLKSSMRYYQQLDQEMLTLFPGGPFLIPSSLYLRLFGEENAFESKSCFVQMGKAASPNVVFTRAPG